ncbi:hypothetical protein JL720_5447 [Aureococcus anophagefferens]|nr:hypothetical protein JL720_5447 [Aureococcus anophagefferens]
MDPLFHKPKINPLGMLGSEARGLCCAPKSEVFDRLVAFVSTINVMSGLVLSAIASLATAPLVVEALPSNKRFLGSLFNVLAFVSVATQICVVMFSTYMLFLVYCHGHSPSAIYRALVHSQTLIGACMLGVYFPLLLWLGMIVIASQIASRSGPVALHVRRAPRRGVPFPLHLQLRARVPARDVGWHAVTAPWLFWSGRVRADVERNDAARGGAGRARGKDDDHDGVPGGFAVVMGLLDFSQAGSGIELFRGERLALATALMKEATPVDAYR